MVLIFIEENRSGSQCPKNSNYLVVLVQKLFAPDAIENAAIGMLISGMSPSGEI